VIGPSGTGNFFLTERRRGLGADLEAGFFVAEASATGGTFRSLSRYYDCGKS
jgi:hypothetical protein